MFITFLAQNIGNYQDRYERFIKGLKTDGFEVHGYAIKYDNLFARAFVG